MIKECSKIKIVFSPQLVELKLAALINLTGTVIEDLSDCERKNKGFMVQLSSAYLNEYLWFIPFQSVVEDEHNT